MIAIPSDSVIYKELKFKKNVKSAKKETFFALHFSPSKLHFFISKPILYFLFGHELFRFHCPYIFEIVPHI